MASKSSGGSGSGSKSSRKKDPCWEYGTEVPHDKSKSYVYVQCKFCNQVITGGICRLKDHLAGTHRGSKPCESVTEEAKRSVLDLLNKKKQAKQKAQDEFDETANLGAYYVRGSHGGGGGSTSFEVEKRTKVGTIERFFTRQEYVNVDVANVQAAASLHNNPKEARRLVSLDIGRFFFENGIAFNVIESPSFISMCRSIASYGLGLKTPSRHELGTWILKEEVSTTNSYTEEIRKTWTQTGVSILSDGWKDMKGRSLINFLVNNPYGTVFLKSVDASDAIKDANLLFELS